MPAVHYGATGFGLAGVSSCLSCYGWGWRSIKLAHAIAGILYSRFQQVRARPDGIESVIVICSAG